MKSSKKALAFALAAAMVVTAFPVTNAEAASTAKLNKKSVTVAVGADKKQTKSIKVTTPSTWKSVKVKVSSSNKKVATVKASGKTVKVTAVKKGSAKVTVKVTAKKGKKAVSKTLKANVKVVNAGLKFTAAPTEMAVGAEDKVTTKKCPSVAKVSYKSSDDTIATVDVATGVVKAVKAGKVTITATSDYGKSVTTDITVKKAILKSAVQTKYNTIVATIEGDTANLKAADFKVTNTATKATVAVQSAKASKTDATQVSLVVFGNMTDGKDYTVEYDGTTATFTATDAKVADVKLSRDTVPFGTETTVNVQTVDAKGIVIKDIALNDTTKNVTVKQTSTKGYITGTDVYLPAKGDAMTLDVTYGEKKYDQTGKDTTEFKRTLTVAAVDPAEAEYAYSVTLGSNVPAWKANSFKATSTLKVGDDTNAFIRIQDTSVDPAKDLAQGDYAKYTVESSDKTKLLVFTSAMSGATTPNVGSQAINIKAVAAGTAYIIVKKDNNYVASLPLTIEASSVATTIELDKDTVSVVSGQSGSTAVATATVKDQYGKAMDASAFANKEIKLLSSPDNVTVANLPTLAVNAAKNTTVTFAGGNFAKAGNYVYLLTVKVGNVTMTRTITVKVVDRNTTKTYALEISAGDTVDTTVKADTNAANTFTIKVAELENGAPNGYVSSVSSVSIKKAGTTTIANVGAGVSGADVVTSAAVSNTTAYSAGTLTVDATSVSTASSSKYYTKNLEAGFTYVVEATFTGNDGKAATVRGSFSVKDDNDKNASYEFIKNDFTGKTVKAAFEDPTLVAISYDGIVQNGVVVSDITGKDLAAGQGAFVEKVTCFVQISGSNNFVPVTITVNDQVAKCAGLK